MKTTLRKTGRQPRLRKGRRFEIQSKNGFLSFKNIYKMEEQNKNNSLSIEIKPDVAKGHYSNLAVITHSQSEFVVDFASMLPGFPKPEVSSRIIMNPENAKKLLLALQDNVNKYEAQFGPITFGQDSKPKTFPMGGFGPKNGNIS